MGLKKNAFNKIPLPWEVEVERDFKWENTHAYWIISQDWNERGISAKSTTIGDALQDCNEIISSQHTSPRLLYLVGMLRNDIITHGTKRAKTRGNKKNEERIVAKTFVL